MRLSRWKSYGHSEIGRIFGRAANSWPTISNWKPLRSDYTTQRRRLIVPLLMMPLIFSLSASTSLAADTNNSSLCTTSLTPLEKLHDLVLRTQSYLLVQDVPIFRQIDFRLSSDPTHATLRSYSDSSQRVVEVDPLFFEISCRIIDSYVANSYEAQSPSAHVSRSWDSFLFDIDWAAKSGWLTCAQKHYDFQLCSISQSTNAKSFQDQLATLAEASKTYPFDISALLEEKSLPQMGADLAGVFLLLHEIGHHECGHIAGGPASPPLASGMIKDCIHASDGEVLDGTQKADSYLNIEVVADQFAVSRMMGKGTVVGSLSIALQIMAINEFALNLSKNITPAELDPGRRHDNYRCRAGRLALAYLAGWSGQPIMDAVASASLDELESDTRQKQWLDAARKPHELLRGIASDPAYCINLKAQSTKQLIHEWNSILLHQQIGIRLHDEDFFKELNQLNRLIAENYTYTSAFAARTSSVVILDLSGSHPEYLQSIILSVLRLQRREQAMPLRNAARLRGLLGVARLCSQPGDAAYVSASDNIGAAKADFERALYLDPEHLASALSLAEIQLFQTDYVAAKQTIGTALASPKQTGEKTEYGRDEKLMLLSTLYSLLPAQPAIAVLAYKKALPNDRTWRCMEHLVGK